MTTGSPTRTSRTSATDSDESIASREFVTFMTRPATVLPRLAFTASTRTGRLGKKRTSFAGTWTPIRCASRATSPRVRRSSWPDEATIARRVVVSTRRVRSRALSWSSRTWRRAATSDDCALVSSAWATLTSPTSFAPSLCARATSAPVLTRMALADATDAARSACACVTPCAASRAAVSAARRSLRVASDGSVTRFASAWRASSCAAASAFCFATTSASAWAMSRWPLAPATVSPEVAFAAAPCAAASRACAVATRSAAELTAWRAVFVSMRAWATSAGRAVRCACSTLLTACSRASRAWAAAASAV